MLTAIVKDQIKDEICTLAARRHCCWVEGDAAEARRLTNDLDKKWQQLRGEVTATRAAVLAPLHIVRVDNPVDRFIADRCTLTRGAISTVRATFDAYLSWAAQEGEDAISVMRLTRELKRRGVETTRTKTVRGYRGLAVTAFAQSPLANAA